jgi:hypothetical protein
MHARFGFPVDETPFGVDERKLPIVEETTARGEFSRIDVDAVQRLEREDA